MAYIRREKGKGKQKKWKKGPKKPGCTLTLYELSPVYIIIATAGATKRGQSSQSLTAQEGKSQVTPHSNVRHLRWQEKERGKGKGERGSSFRSWVI
jgi:hypothetical protein